MLIDERSPCPWVGQAETILVDDIIHGLDEDLRINKREQTRGGKGFDKIFCFLVVDQHFDLSLVVQTARNPVFSFFGRDLRQSLRPVPQGCANH